MSSTGISAYAAYLPRHRLERSAIGEALELRAGGGSRVVASYDEDSTTMAVEAARQLIDGEAAPPGAVLFATTTPAYLDKANSSALHAALGLGHDGFAADVAGSPRSSIAALALARASGGLAVLSDVRTGLPGAAEERDGGDGAVAFRFSADGPVEVIGEASMTAELLDRWRVPGELTSRQWEERFVVESYMPLIRDTAAAALAGAGLDKVDRIVVSSPHARVTAQARKQLQAGADELPLGYSGAADFGLRLAAALDDSAAGDTILALSATDGCDAWVLRVNDRIEQTRAGTPLREQLTGGRELPYVRYLTWRGLLEREPPRRPEPDRPAGPPAARSERWKFAFVGSACNECGQVHLPPRRVCVKCASVDNMQQAPLSSRAGTVATYTVDRLAFSPSPPTIDAVIDFDGGGRYTLEVTDAAAEDVVIGTRVEPTFRRLYTVDGVHNYFWKARPIDG